jgi:hypothetical protein
MANIKINQSPLMVNLISNMGTPIEVDEVTLKRWNDVIGEWWKVQLEMDKYLQTYIMEKIEHKHEWAETDGFDYCTTCSAKFFTNVGIDD